jgi:hypothetical protein
LLPSINNLSYKNGMSTLTDTPASAVHVDGKIFVGMESGLVFSFPCETYPKLASATQEERSRMELSPMGIHWPLIDEDLSIRGLLRDHALRG